MPFAFVLSKVPRARRKHARADAYEEFAQAPYDDVKQIKGDMKREQLLGWIKDINVATDRKRLYFTLLGVCGLPEDTEMLEKMLREDKPDGRPGVDACIGCYLTLKGESGLPLINELFLQTKSVHSRTPMRRSWPCDFMARKVV